MAKYRSKNNGKGRPMMAFLLVMLAAFAVWWGVNGAYTGSPGESLPSETPLAGMATASSTAAELSPQEETDVLVARFLSVGDADSILIMCGGQSMLVDAGTAGTKEQVVEAIREEGIDTLDFVVATHPHEDHIGGMAEVLMKIGAKQFYLSYIEHTTKAYERMLNAVVDNDIPAEVPKPGDSFLLGGAVCTFLAPLREDYSEMNDASLVIQVEFAGKTLLLTGDVEIASERDMALTYEEDLSCDILKVAHHGSKTSTSELFYSLAQPDYVIITCEETGRPHSSVLNRLKESNAEIYMTADGEIICEIGIDVKFYKR